jgi:hypothetical protein
MLAVRRVLTGSFMPTDAYRRICTLPLLLEDSDGAMRTFGQSFRGDCILMQ